MSDRSRKVAQEFADAAISQGTPLAWFERLYSSANGEETSVPWADMCPNPHMLVWLQRQSKPVSQEQALVVGCGLGDDAEALAAHGYRVTGFDIAPTAIGWCQRRFPQSKINYTVGDLFKMPSWERSFDLVLETYTVQALPESIRGEALKRIASFVQLGGTLLVITRGRDAGEPLNDLSWPLARPELEAVKQVGMEEVSFEDYWDTEHPPTRRFRIEYLRRE